MATLNSLSPVRKLEHQVELLSPAVDTSLVLPTGAGLVGRLFTIVNSGTANILVRSSNNDLVRTVYPSTTGQVTPNTDSPTTGAHWEGVGTAESNWRTYTPTGADMWTTNVTHTALWRRKGPNMQLQYGITCSGAPSGGDPNSLRFYLPFGSIDTAAMASGSANRSSLGHWQGEVSGSGNMGGGIRKHVANDKLELWFSNVDSSDANSFDVITQAFFTANGKAFAWAEVPISGWTVTKG